MKIFFILSFKKCHVFLLKERLQKPTKRTTEKWWLIFCPATVCARAMDSWRSVPRHIVDGNIWLEAAAIRTKLGPNHAPNKKTIVGICESSACCWKRQQFAAPFHKLGSLMKELQLSQHFCVWNKYITSTRRQIFSQKKIITALFINDWNNTV